MHANELEWKDNDNWGDGRRYADGGKMAYNTNSQ